MIQDIDPLLRRLAEPAPPPTLAATVMARIAREPDRDGARVAARRPVTARGDRSAWVSAIVGLSLVIGLIVHGWVSIGSPPDVMSARIGLFRGVLLPVQGAGVLLVGLGLWLFLFGLFAPLRGGKRV